MKNRKANIMQKTNPKKFQVSLRGDVLLVGSSSILFLKPKRGIPPCSQVQACYQFQNFGYIKVNKPLSEEKTQLRFEDSCHFPLFSHNSVPVAIGKGQKERAATVACASTGAEGHHFTLWAGALSHLHLQRKEMLFMHKTKQENLYNYFWLSSIEIHSPGSSLF